MDEEKFKALLDEQHQFPSAYTFKFIVEKDNLAAVKALFENEAITVKPSKGGKYMSITAKTIQPKVDIVLTLCR